MELARLSNDEQATILLTLCFSIHLGVLGELDAHYRYASQAARLARSLGATGLHRACRLAMLSSLLHQGRIGEALDLAEAALGAPLERGPGEGYLDDALTHRACTLGLRALLLSLSGRMDSAGRELERAMKLNAEIEEPETRGYLHGFYVQHALCSGEVELALHHGREAARLADQTGIPLQIADAYLNLGGALLLAEDWSSALEALERCRAIVEARESLASFRSRLSLFLSHVHLGRGEGELALRCAEESLANPATADTRVVELNSRLALVRALLYTQQSGAADAIQESLVMAIDGIDKTGAEAFRPTIHRVLAEIAEVARDERTRRLQLRRAHDLYSRIGARGHAHRLASSCSDVTDRVEEAIGRVADEVPDWLRSDSGPSAGAAPRDRGRS
jgi:tetratricopeptide (TPR) repeat protein